MKGIRFVKNVFLVGFFFFVAQHKLCASSTVEIACPSVEELKKYKLRYTDTKRFVRESQQVIFSGLLDLGKEDYKSSYWVLSVSGMKAGKGDNLVAILNETIENLQPVSSEPFVYTQYRDEEDTGMCFYTLPGDEDVNAEVHFFKNYLGNSINKNNFNNYHHNIRGDRR